MADKQPPAKKHKADTSSAPECPFGQNCYRKNPKHFQEFSHSKLSAADVKSAAALTAVLDPSLPPCKYGASCYRQNWLHFANYSHPTSGPTKEETDSDTDVIDSDDEKVYGASCYRQNWLHFANYSHPTSGPTKAESDSDTDVIDSDDEKKSEKDNPDNDLLSKGMSLVKRFSQVTETEQRELIEEKLRLQQELEITKKTVAEKDRELELQKQMNPILLSSIMNDFILLNKGLLKLEGEDEALAKDVTTYFSLYPEREYKEGSASQTHFRLAESQFYRLLTGDDYSSIRVLKVDYVISPKVVKRFRECQEKLKKTRGESYSYSILGFHGTEQKNIRPICENGFKAPGDQGFMHKTDSGWYGAGIYFSEYTQYSMAYISDCSELMLCQILPGKMYECTGLLNGANLKPGYDSHMSPCKKEVVIFDTSAILPCYIIYFKDAWGEFSYSDPIYHLYDEAASAQLSKVFNGVRVILFGQMADSKAALYELVCSHGGTKGVIGKVDLLVTTPESSTGSSKVILEARKQNVPIVREEYIYQCIVQNKLLPFNDYKL